MKQALKSLRGLAFGASLILAGWAGTGSAQAGEVFTLDTAHTHVVFSVDRFGFAKTVGSFKDVTGTIDLDEENPENTKVSVTIGTQSIDSDHDTREEHLRSEFWFNAVQFPSMTFTSTKVERTGETTAKMTGDLTLLGQTAPVTLDVTLNKIGPDPVTKRKAVGFSATGGLTRSTFGMNTALGRVGDAVNIHIEVLALAGE